MVIEKSAEVVVAMKKKKNREGLNLLMTRSRLRCLISTEQ